MLTRLALLWLALLLPWTLSGAIGGPIGLLPHAVFHPLYIGFLLLSVWAAWALRAATGHRGVRVLALLVAVMSVLAIVGQTGEEVVVIAHGGLDAPDSLMEDPVHFAWAAAGEGGLFFGLFLMTALSVIAGVGLLRHADRRGWAALACGVASVIDFVLLFGGMTVPPPGILTLVAAVVLLVVARTTRAQLTALDIAGPLHRQPASVIVAL